MGEVAGPCRSKGLDTASGDGLRDGLIGSGTGPPTSSPGFGNGCCPIPSSDPGTGGIESSGVRNGSAGGISFALVPTGDVSTGDVSTSDVSTGDVSTGDVSTADGRTVEGQSAVPGGTVPGGTVPGGVAHNLVVGRATCSSAPASPAAMTKTKRLSKSAMSRARLFSLRGRIHVSALL
jgi:hypothetical protein